MPKIRSRAVLGALLVALALPASAAAETLTVDPADDNNACTRGSDNRCKTIAQAISAAQAADTITIAKGTYAESVSVPDTKDDLTIKGASAETKLVGNGTADVLSVAADNVKVQTLTIETPADGSGGLLLSGAAAQVSDVIVTRANATASTDPLIEVTGSAALDRLFVIANTGGAGAPAILSSGTAGTALTDVFAVSAKGDAARFTNSEANRVVRSTLLTVEPGSDGVEVFSAASGSTTAKKLFLDSSVLVGGANGAGLNATTASGTPSSSAGDIAIDARHLTIPTVGKGMVINAAANGLVLTGATGDIAATVASSIVHGPITVEHADNLGLTAANTASLTMTKSDADPAKITGDGTKNISETSFTPDDQLFPANKITLRADAPVIDKGGDLPAGESEKDVEGEPRKVGAATDIGADEFVNKAPNALFGITNKAPRENEKIALISGSSDPEGNAGGGIVEYRWDYGDGTKETTAAGAVVHTYTRRGTYQATLQTVDKQGLASPVSPAQTITVTDGVFPKVEIKQPTAGQRLTLNPAPKKGSKKRPKPRQLVVFGPASDESGVKSVEVAVVLTKRDPVKKRTAAKSQARTCEHFSGRFFVKRACDKEVWLKAAVNAANWAYVSKAGLRLPAGRYELRVRATDNSGLLTTPSTKDKTIVSFRVK